MNIIINLSPFFAIAWFIFFIKKNQLNNILTGLIFVSYLFFATNYQNFGTQIDFFRYAHRFIGIIAILFLLIHIVRFKVNLFKEKVPILLALFLLSLLCSFVGNDIYLQYYFHYVRNFIFISGIVLYLYYFIDSDEKLHEIFNLIVSLTLILTFIALFELLIRGSSGRLNLFYGNPNYLAIALIPGFTLALFSEKKILSFSSILILIVIFETGSLAAQASSIFTLLTYLYFKVFKKIYLFPLLIFITLLIYSFFDSIVDNKDKSSVRLALAGITLNIFEQHPLNGIGYGQFRRNFYHYIDLDIVQIGNDEINTALFSNRPLSPLLDNSKYYDLAPKDKEKLLSQPIEKMTHNDLFTIITELGLIGLSFLVFFIFKLYAELKKLLLHSRINYYKVIAIIASSLIFSLFHNNMTSFMFWFVIIIPFIMNRNYKKY